MTMVQAECGHNFETRHEPNVLENCTMDCPECGRLLIYPDGTALAEGTVQAKDFHRYLHDTTEFPDGTRWPVDGADTYSIEFDAGQGGVGNGADVSVLGTEHGVDPEQTA